MSYRKLTSAIYVVLTVIGCTGLFAQTASAEDIVDEGRQAIDNEINAGTDLKGAREGWQMEYGGFRQSPILFDPREDSSDLGSTRRRTYPPMNDEGLGKMREGQMNISVDDELDKTKLAIFQPIHSAEDGDQNIQTSFADNARLRDNHLNLFRTVRAVAIMTLSYLDKTVAAGLATTQQQVDQDTTHQLLKQISWTTSKLANPDRDQLYNDLDEKFEFCMHSHGAGLSPIYMKHVNIECPRCQNLLPPGGPSTGGAYHYCVCCAETGKVVNQSIHDSTGEPYWSLVERLFYGLQKPVGEITAGENTYKAEAIVNYGTFFAALYGDIRFENPTSGQETMTFRYVSPHWSVPNAISYLRDLDDGHASCQQTDEVFFYCPITGSVVQTGICPAFRQLLEWEHAGVLEQKRQDNPAQLNNLWIEASLGGPITVEDLTNILKMRTDDNPNVKLFDSVTKGNSSHKRLSKYVESFCDASAVTAFKKLHVRMMSIALDHMALNRKATERDKAMARQLMSRVSQYLELGGIDSRSSNEEMLVAAGIESDMKQAAQTTAAWAAAASAQETQNQIGEILPAFGGSMETGPISGP